MFVMIPLAHNNILIGNPPPPCLGTALRKNRTLVPLSKSRTTFFYHGIGFFMVLVDAGHGAWHMSSTTSCFSQGTSFHKGYG